MKTEEILKNVGISPSDLLVTHRTEINNWYTIALP